MQDEFGDDQDLYNEVAGATDIDDLPEDTEPEIDGRSSTTASPARAPSDTDTTDTTVAGDATTTTAAG